MSDVVKKIDKLLKERNWSVYKLALETGLTQQTIHAWFNPRRATIPTIATLEMVCDAFEMTLSEFFSDIPLTNFNQNLS